MATRYAVAAGNWDNPIVWSETSGGAPGASVPTYDDDVVFDSASGAINFVATVTTVGSTYPEPRLYCRNLTCTGFTGTISGTTKIEIYGDLTLVSGMTYTHTGGYSFRNNSYAGTTQTIISAGKTIGPIDIAPVVGTVVLGDSLTCGAIVVYTGTLSTSASNYTLSCASLFVKPYIQTALDFNSSSINVSGNLTIPNEFNYDDPECVLDITSATITLTGATSALAGTNRTFGTVVFSPTTAGTFGLSSAGMIFNDLTVNGPTTGIGSFSLAGNITVTGTLTMTGNGGGSQLRVISNTLGTQRTITAAAYAGSATDVTWRDIIVAGAAAPISGTRFGNMGNNSGITMSAPKTVYWNLAGSQTWTATAWATTSGGSPGIDNYPLPQDTGVFDDAGSITTLTLSGDVMGTVDMSARTSAMTVTASTTLAIFGGWKFGSGVTNTANTNVITFRPVGTMSMECGAVPFQSPVTIDTGADLRTGTIQLSGAFLMNADKAFTVTRGTFDANNYNVTCGSFTSTGTTVRSIKAGSGVWSISGVGSTTVGVWTTIWNISDPTNLTWDPGTAEILFSTTSNGNRQFNSGGIYYHKFTVGGTTGTGSVLMPASASYFGEITSIKTVSHSIRSDASTFYIGYFNISGSAGAVFSLTGNVSTLWTILSQNSSIDYLSFGSFAVGGTGITLYAGANTGIGSFVGGVVATAPPAARTLYWVGGTGNINNTAKWSLSSGGAGGEAVPREMDTVIFDANSNATAYTVTINTTFKCKDLTIGAPGSGNVTFNQSGTPRMWMFGNVDLAGGANITWSYTDQFYLQGPSSNYTLDSNGVTLGAVAFFGNGKYTLTGNLTSSGALTFAAGEVDFDTYDVSVTQLLSDYRWTRKLSLGSGTTTLSNATPLSFGTVVVSNNTLTINPGTSTIVSNAAAATTFNGVGRTYGNLQRTGAGALTLNGNNTFNNVSFTSTTATTNVIAGSNTFNNLTFTAAASGVMAVTFGGNQTINGTLTASGASSLRRFWMYSNTFGTTRTLSVATYAASAQDVDFRDIAVTGAAAPLTGTRFGDLFGNSGITMSAPKTVYWNLAGTQDWTATAWATSSGGVPDADNFPLAQDTAVFDNAGSADNVSFNSAYATPTVDCSARTVPNYMSFSANGTVSCYGSFTLSSATSNATIVNHALAFYGRNSTFTYTSATKTFRALVVQAINGIVQLQDAVSTFNTTTDGYLQVLAGTLDLNDYTVTTGNFYDATSLTHTIDFGTSSEILLNRQQTGANASMLDSLFTTNPLKVIGTSVFKLTNPNTTAAEIRLVRPFSKDINIEVTGGSGQIAYSRNSVWPAIFRDFILNDSVTSFDSGTGSMNCYGLLHLGSGFAAMTTGGGTHRTWMYGKNARISSSGASFILLSSYGKLTLESAVTTTSFFHWAGELNLNGYTLTGTAGYYYGGGGAATDNDFSTRILRSAGAVYNITGNNQVIFWGGWSTGDNRAASSMVINRNDPFVINSTYSGSAGTRTFQYSGRFSSFFGSSLESFGINITGGTDIIATNGMLSNLNFTGYTGTLALGSRTFVGDMTFDPGMTVAAGSTFTACNFSKPSSIISNGITLDIILNVTTILPSYYKLLENQSLGSTRTLTINGGGIDFNDFNLSVGLLVSSNSAARLIDFGSSTVTIEGAGNAWNFTTGTNAYTVNGTGTINMTSASAKTFIGGGRSWPKLNQGGAGSLSITGTNTFADISNTNPTACTIIFPNATTTVANFTASGTSGNLLTLSRTGASGTFTLSKSGGVVGVDYISVSNSIATGGATWYAGANSTDAGNNTGWIFTAPPPPSGATGNMFFMF